MQTFVEVQVRDVMIRKSLAEMCE